MTDLYTGQLLDLIQNYTRYSAEVQAFSYALLQEKRRLMDLAQKTRTMAAVDDLPEAALDLLAVELRTPYFSSDLDISKKKEVIKSTLTWFFHSGTPSAVEELVAAVFGQGEVVEWFDFTEAPFTPGTFDLITDTRMTEDIASRFLQIIGRVKNTRSHLRRVLVERKGYQDVYIGAGAIAAPAANVLNSTDTALHACGEKIAVGAGATSAPEGIVLNNLPERSMGGSAAACIGAGVAAHPKETVWNHVPARGRAASGAVRIGAVLAVEGGHTAVLNSPPPGTASIRQTQRIFTAAVASSAITIP